MITASACPPMIVLKALGTLLSGPTTDDIDAHVIAGLLRSGAAQASYVPDEQIQSLRELARLRARLMADRQDYLRQLIAPLDVVLPEHRAVLGDLLTARARGTLARFPTA